MKIIATLDAPAAIGPYVQGKIVNGLLYASGQIPLNPSFFGQHCEQII